MTTTENRRRDEVSRPASINKFPLLRRLSIVSILTMLVTASILIFLYREEQLVEHTQIAAQRNEETAIYLMQLLDEQIAHLISNSHGYDVHALQTNPEITLFTAALQQVHENNFAKLKIYNPSGVVLYSSVHSEIGGSSQHPEFVASALSGETVHQTDFRKTFLGRSGEMHDVYVSLVYMPLTYAGKRIGVIEVYDDATSIFRHLQSSIIRIVQIVFSAFAMLYAALFFAVSRTDRDIAKWQKNIAESEATLRESQLIAGVGDYVLDIPANFWKSSEMLDQLFGIDDTYEHTVQGWEALVHPDDRTIMVDYLQNEVIVQGRKFDKQFRIIRHNDQAERRVHALGRLEFDAFGHPLKLHGTLQDITEQKRAEEVVAESRNLLQTIIDAAPVRIFWKDQGLHYLGCNPSFAQDAGEASPQDVIGKDDYQLGWRAQAERYRADDRKVMESGVAKISYDEPTTTPDGKTIWLRTSKVPLRNTANEIIGVLGVYQDITGRKLANIALQESENHLRQSQAIAHVGSWTCDLSGKLKWSDELYRIYGVSPETFTPTIEALIKLVHPDDRPAMQAWIEDCISGQNPGALEFRCMWPDGTIRYINGQGEFVFDAEGRPSHLSGTAQDITRRKLAEEAWRVAAVAFETHDAILITDAHSTIVQVNKAFSEITGYRAEDVLGKNPRFMNSGRQDRSFYVEMWQKLLHSGSWAGEIWDKRKNGEIYPKWMTITAVKDQKQATTHYVAIFSDITARKKTEGEIHHLAFYDALTKLPNRRLFLDRLHAALVASARRNDYGAVLFIDMDRFKALNDTLGHDYGDLLLIEVGQRIKACVREMDTVARYGGDEFVVLIDALSDDRDDVTHRVALIAEKIREALVRPYKLKEHEHHSSPSIGISLYHGNEESLEMLIEHADMAMYQVKKTGRNAVRFFDPIMQHDLAAHDALENDLHHALALQQLQLHYQIQVDKDNRPLGAEAFLRWMHPEHGKIMPGQFIPVAEEGTLIIDIDRWVLKTVCQQLALWSKNDKTRDLTLTVNISAKLFAQPGFVDEVTETLHACQADPVRLKLELSERLVLTDINSSMAKIQALKNLGVRLSMDNFATVYSSLSYLKQLSPDQLKIHREFVQGIALEGNDALLVRTVANLAKSLDLNVFAEGVETEQQRTLLDSYNCDSYQGYLFGKPVSIEEFEVMFARL